jgi:hypothetical protein
MDLFSLRSRALTPELKALIGQKIYGKPPSKRAIWLLVQQAAQNTRRTIAEAKRTVAGQAASAVHQEVARFAAAHAGRAPAVPGDAAKRTAARIAVAEVQRHHATWSMAQLRFEVHRALPVLPPGADGEAVGTEVATLAVSGRRTRNGTAPWPISTPNSRSSPPRQPRPPWWPRPGRARPTRCPGSPGCGPRSPAGG